MSNRTVIYFFSGTGNTLFLARELCRRIPDATLVPIAALRDQRQVVPGCKTIGFCFPNHGGQLPTAMRKFVEKLKLAGDEYLFALVSSGGTGCNAFETINKVVKENAPRLRGEFLIQVPSFNPKTDDLSTLPSEHDIEEFRRTVPAKLDRIADAVINEKTETVSDAPPYRLPWIIAKLVPFVLRVVERFPSFQKAYFYADPSCTGCATCVRVCPTCRITVKDRTPTWDATVPCYFCHACLAFCPVGAVQVTPKLIWAGSKTTTNPRFTPPLAAIEEIARQREETEYRC